MKAHDVHFSIGDHPIAAESVQAMVEASQTEQGSPPYNHDTFWVSLHVQITEEQYNDIVKSVYGS